MSDKKVRNGLICAVVGFALTAGVIVAGIQVLNQGSEDNNNSLEDMDSTVDTLFEGTSNMPADDSYNDDSIDDSYNKIKDDDEDLPTRKKHAIDKRYKIEEENNVWRSKGSVENMCHRTGMGKNKKSATRAPGSCTKYYKCMKETSPDGKDKYETFLFECQEGLQFDEGRGLCLPKDKVKCADENKSRHRIKSIANNTLNTPLLYIYFILFSLFGILYSYFLSI